MIRAAIAPSARFFIEPEHVIGPWTGQYEAAGAVGGESIRHRPRDARSLDRKPSFATLTIEGCPSLDRADHAIAVGAGTLRHLLDQCVTIESIRCWISAG